MDATEYIYRHEGMRQKPYLDCCGKPWRECTCAEKGNLTIGPGINLDEGLSATILHYIFQDKLEHAKQDLNRVFPWAAARLNDARYAVLLDLVYNMGIGRLMGFKNTMAAIKDENWQRAHDELLYQDPSKGNWEPNKYWKDVGDGPGKRFDRAERNARQILMGEWQK